jgi:hypothetical protein
MESAPFPPKPVPLVSFSEAIFLATLALFLAIVCIWPILTGRIHHFSTWVPDALHTYPVHQHGVTFYLQPALGKFYVSLPWLWCALFAATILTGFLTKKSASGK